jgi:hypothetical protein
MGSSVSIGPIAAKLPQFTRALAHHCPVKTAAAFGGLLLQKRLQSNCLRLELLVHLCLCFGKGVRAPTQSLLTRGFTSVETICGYLEDPREDVFVGNIHSIRGNYRVLEGIWEGATFYLQRIVNMVDSLPGKGHFKDIADAVHALLKISDVVCERAGLTRNDIGPDGRNHVLPKSLGEKSDRLRNLVALSIEDLASYGLDVDSLGPFIFDPRDTGSLLGQAISNTSLEAAPLVIKDKMLSLLLPTAVSVAIRRFVVKALGEQDNRVIFLHQLGREYSRLFSTSPFFGDPGPSLPFVHRSSGSLCAIGQEIDAGRYLTIVFFLDDLVGFEQDGFGGVFLGSPDLKTEIRKAIQSMQEDCERRDGFKEGITLVVGCGIGRGVVLDGFHQPRSSWAWEFVSAPDLIALAHLDEIQALDLLRVLRMESSLRQSGVTLQNMNGLLNLFAWADSLDGHLVPHAEIPREFSVGEAQLFMPITQNGLGDLRHRLTLTADEHVERFVDGTWKLVRREGRSHFEEDTSRPLYVHLEQEKKKRLLGARITKTRCWWYEAVARAGSVDRLIYERWSMMGVWVARVVDAIDAEFGAEIGHGPLFWRCVFNGDPSSFSVDEFGRHEDLADAFAVNVNLATRTIELQVGPGFDRATYHPHNIAEVGLARAFLSGVSSLTGVSLAGLEAALADKLSDVNARHCHVFSATGYRDYFRDTLSRSPVTISIFDDALLKLGLGWRVRDPMDGGKIVSRSDCLSFLRALVGQLQGELADHLKLFDREALLKALLINYESASHSRDWWHKTAAAMLALGEDKAVAMNRMSRHEFKLNGALQSTRNLIEIALCESPLGEGNMPGELDLALMLAQSAQIFHLSGWCDLIHWDLLEPELVIRPLGDVHAHHDFMDTVMEPFGKASSEYRYASSIKRYAKSLGSATFLADAKDSGVPLAFLDAWQEEFGVHLDAYRRFVDALENHGISHDQMLFILPRSALVGLADTPDVGLAIVKSLELAPRPAWRVPPEGYAWKDIALSRFRRRLGLLRRPLIQIEPGDDPRYLVNPALVREGFGVMVGNYYEGAYADDHLGPAMLKYAGAARKRNGAEFNERVASRMEELGWRVEREIKLTKVLHKGFDRDYGDIDVLAWEAESGRVLIMECKDLQFRKTYGEIAEQLSDYRGRASADGKKRDSLRKHLDRIAVLRDHPVELARFLGLGSVDKLESHLVFSHPVPMMFSNALGRDVAATHTYDSLPSFERPLLPHDGHLRS